MVLFIPIANPTCMLPRNPVQNIGSNRVAPRSHFAVRTGNPAEESDEGGFGRRRSGWEWRARSSKQSGSEGRGGGRRADGALTQVLPSRKFLQVVTGAVRLSKNQVAILE